ncbi:hypothetical protein A0H76_2541 [Hepatospora eriocheir]|uniref:Peptidase A2 domain-containing protein n=1 Tax=Hepatospora eriocheir TaxID=1081669 RepID=A0A1X0QJP4_9MICR|nr:hypothetical protein A0H76_2541 [Hepatospora eriocheir]
MEYYDNKYKKEMNLCYLEEIEETDKEIIIKTEVNINGIDVMALIDTGANVSFINEEVAIKTNMEIEEIETQNVRTANNEQSIKKRAIIDIEFNGYNTNMKLYIVKIYIMI